MPEGPKPNSGVFSGLKAAAPSDLKGRLKGAGLCAGAGEGPQDLGTMTIVMDCAGKLAERVLVVLPAVGAVMERLG